jgi:hypothetical protein
MDCTSCGTANAVGRKFCRECGARLGVQCPACGTIDSGGSKFCGECGSALDVGPGGATTPALPDRPPVAERRLVSVMFADLVGFTAEESERAWLATRLGALVGAEPVPEDDRGELFAASRRFFEQLAAGRPLVLVFEDLHWADAGMLDFIESLLQWSRAHPLLVTTLARPRCSSAVPHGVPG